MSTLISAENIGHSFHDNWLFRNQTFGINTGRRVALVGANGAGKTTLLKLLAEKMNPTEGKVVKSKFLSMGYLEQDPIFKPEDTIQDFIFRADNEQQQLILAYENLLENDPENYDAIEDITNKLTDCEAWEYEYKIKNILDRLGVHHLDQKISTLSGGQRKRIAMAELLISDPELYILDEPTNHLDIETIEWLESFLNEGNKTILLVTHDRYFLDNVCNEILEINQQKIITYRGNYSYYLEKRAEQDAADDITLQKNNNLLKKELEWMRRMPQARGTKSKARIDAFYDLQGKTQGQGPKDSLELTMKAARQGGKILEIEQLDKAFGEQVIIKNFSYTFKKGDRIGLAGKNGSGKSTFLNLINGITEPDTGKINKGDTTTFGYYRQVGLDFNNQYRVIDLIKEVAEFITMADGKVISASQLLTKFLFPPKKQHGMIANLSGGEKKRLQLLLVLIKNPNFLILDEPTNDLDIDTLNVLEDFLVTFPGIILIVSHDRYLIDRIADQLFIFKDGGEIAVFNGNYSAFRAEELDLKLLAETKKLSASSKTITKLFVGKSFGFKEAKELEEIEQNISLLEADITQQTSLLNDVNIANERSTSIYKEITSMKNQLTIYTDRWLELSEIKDSQGI